MVVASPSGRIESIEEVKEMLSPRGRDVITRSEEFRQSGLYEHFVGQPIGFVDAGIRGGAHDLLAPVASLTSVLGFEPDTAECQRLNASPDAKRPWGDFSALPFGLAGNTGSQTFYNLAAETNHSLLPPNMAFTKRYRMGKFQQLSEQHIFCTTLDELFVDHRPPRFRAEMIKLDTQGSEYDILHGAEKTLRSETMLIFTEVSFCEIYAGQKRFSEIEIFLRGIGFSFYGFGPLHRRSRKFLDKRREKSAERLLYADAHFIKDPLDAALQYSQITLRSEALAYVGALVFGYFDLAIELAFEARHLGGKTERNALVKLARHFAKHDPGQSVADVETLSQAIRGNPGEANILVGGFVDERRELSDYDDVRNVSPLSKTL